MRIDLRHALVAHGRPPSHAPVAPTPRRGCSRDFSRQGAFLAQRSAGRARSRQAGWLPQTRLFTLAWALVAFAWPSLHCTVITAPPEGSGGGAPDAGPSSTCDAKGDCDACGQCARQDICAEAITACLQNSSCVAIDECLQLCGADKTCSAQCYADNPNGRAAYDAISTCIYCDACALDCKGYASCP